MAGVQRGGREGIVKFERDMRRSRFALEFNFPLPPLCAPATQASLQSAAVDFFCRGGAKQILSQMLKCLNILRDRLVESGAHRSWAPG